MRLFVIALLIALPAPAYAAATPEWHAIDSQADCVWFSGCDSDNLYFRVGVMVYWL